MSSTESDLKVCAGCNEPIQDTDSFTKKTGFGYRHFPACDVPRVLVPQSDLSNDLPERDETARIERNNPESSRAVSKSEIKRHNMQNGRDLNDGIESELSETHPKRHTLKVCPRVQCQGEWHRMDIQRDVMAETNEMLRDEVEELRPLYDHWRAEAERMRPVVEAAIKASTVTDNASDAMDEIDAAVAAYQEAASA